MLKCVVTNIRDDCVAMKPLAFNIGVEGNVTFFLGNFQSNNLKIGNEIVALNVRKFVSGWRAKTILNPIK